MIRLCGACLGLLGFAITILRGLWAGNPADVILSRALWVLVAFCGLGMSMGWVGWRIVQEYAARQEQAALDRKGEPDRSDDEPGEEVAVVGSQDSPTADT